MSNYSFETSYPPFKENPALKKTKCQEVFGLIKYGATNLLQLSELTGMPQAVVSARVNDLITEGAIKYEGFTFYNNRKRKKIVVRITPIVGTQLNFFAPDCTKTHE